jgi:hypothetical protein
MLYGVFGKERRDARKGRNARKEEMQQFKKGPHSIA